MATLIWVVGLKKLQRQLENKGASLARALGGWGKRNMICLCYPLRDSTILFLFGTKIPQDFNRRRASHENTEQALAKYEPVMRGVSRWRADERFTTGVAPQFAKEWRNDFRIA